MAKKEIKKKPQFSDTDSEKIVKQVAKEEKKLTVNGLYLPEKEYTEKVATSLRVEKKLYEKLYKISTVLKIPISKITVTLLENFADNNKHLLK